MRPEKNGLQFANEIFHFRARNDIYFHIIYHWWFFLGVHLTTCVNIIVCRWKGDAPSRPGHVIVMTSSNGNIFRVTGPSWGEFPSHRPVTRSFDVFFDLRLNKRLSKQSRRRWYETPWHSLWRHCIVDAYHDYCFMKIDYVLTGLHGNIGNKNAYRYDWYERNLESLICSHQCGNGTTEPAVWSWCDWCTLKNSKISNFQLVG